MSKRGNAQKPKQIDEVAGPEALKQITDDPTKTSVESISQNDAGQSTKQETYAHVEEDPDFEEFVQIARMTGTIAQDYQTLGLEDKKKFEVGFHQWKKAGKPKPAMPELSKGVVEYPIDIWIAKAKGKIWYYYDTNLGHKLGVKEDNGRMSEYAFEYTVDKMTELMKEREELCPVEQNRNQYVVINAQVHVISEEDLLKPYDKLVELIKTGKITA